MNAVQRTTNFITSIMGVEIEVKTSIGASYETTFDFTMHGMPYTFVINKWSKRGFAKLATLFFTATQRDAAQFGTFSEAADGTVTFSMDTNQKLNLVEQAVKDVISTVDKIGRHYQRAVLDLSLIHI